MPSVGCVVVFDEEADMKRLSRTHLQVALVYCALPQELKQKNVAIRICDGSS